MLAEIMSFFVKLTEAMASRQSLLITGLDPNPEMLRTWSRHNPGNGSFLAQARRWIKTVIEATVENVCAYKPSLGFYQALGPIGIELLHEVRELVPLSVPLILDAKHCDLNTSSALAHYVFAELGVDAITLSPLPGQDIVAPFLLYPERGVVVTCHSSNAASKIFQHHPDEDDPLYLKFVRECQLWGTSEQLLLEVGTSNPAVLARVRQGAPERFVILRSLWGKEERLESMLKAGLTSSADGLLLPLPQNLLVERILSRAPRPYANRSKRCGSASMWAAPIAARSGYRHRARPANQRSRARPSRRLIRSMSSFWPCLISAVCCSATMSRPQAPSSITTSICARSSPIRTCFTGCCMPMPAGSSH